MALGSGVLTSDDALMDGIGAEQARRLWHVAEPLHALAYFAPETIEGWRALGLRGFWMGYFASRCAPMGAVAPEVVTAAYYNFHPDKVRRALPDAWSYASPTVVLDTWRGTAAASLRRLLGGAPSPRAVELLRATCGGLDCAGRPLAAAWAGVPWADEPLGDLWLAATILREHRGDGHVAALLGEEIDGCAAHVLAVAAGANSREAIQPHRGWTDQDWSAAAERLRGRGWLDEGGAITEAGRDARARVERRTDELAAAPLRALGEERAEVLIAELAPLTHAVWSGGGLPYPNPIGLPDPGIGA